MEFEAGYPIPQCHNSTVLPLCQHETWSYEIWLQLLQAVNMPRVCIVNWRQRYHLPVMIWDVLLRLRSSLISTSTAALLYDHWDNVPTKEWVISPGHIEVCRRIFRPQTSLKHWCKFCIYKHQRSVGSQKKRFWLKIYFSSVFLEWIATGWQIRKH